MFSSLSDAQAFMREQRIDLWLIYDFRGSSAVLARLLPPPDGSRRWTTRRVVLAVPARGEARILVHGIDAAQFEFVAPNRDTYLSWPELHGWILKQIERSGQRVAMEYSPGNALPVISATDAGTVELVRSLGGEVVSSANLVQVCVARWSAEALASHRWASHEVTRIKDDAFTLVRDKLASRQGISEREVQQFILQRFSAAGLTASDPPVVAVNEHSADPHFEVSAEGSSTISRGDWLLIDLWARKAGDENIYSDITWVAFAGPIAEVSARHRAVFEAVKRARDAASGLTRDAHARGHALQGWQVDEAASRVLIDAGYREYIRHRTGHSLSAGPMVHGLGVNLDNLETHDTRTLLPGVGWTVEPGLYLPGASGERGFGVRLEINMWYSPERGPEITSCVQDDIVALA